MDNSSLNKLPTELRNNIYQLVLHDQRGITISVQQVSIYKNKLRIDLSDATANRLAITTTSKQIRAESLAIFYLCNSFFIRANVFDWWRQKNPMALQLSSLVQWLKVAGREVDRSQLEVVVHIGIWNMPRTILNPEHVGAQLKFLSHVLLPVCPSIKLRMRIVWDRDTLGADHDLRTSFEVDLPVASTSDCVRSIETTTTQVRADSTGGARQAGAGAASWRSFSRLSMCQYNLRVVAGMQGRIHYEHVT